MTSKRVVKPEAMKNFVGWLKHMHKKLMAGGGFWFEIYIYIYMCVCVHISYSLEFLFDDNTIDSLGRFNHSKGESVEQIKEN